jgi:DNA processing protein
MSSHSDTELGHWLTLAACPQLKTRDILKLASHFGDLSTAFSAPAKAWRAAKMPDALIAQRKTADPKLADAAFRWRDAAANHHIIGIHAADYPEWLKEIASPPLVLYIHGDATLLSKPQLAMVGSRRATPAGAETAYEFAKALASRGWVVTSGLAAGIDAHSHRGAMDAGKTLAVMGTGIDKLYPASNRKLSTQLIESGALITEFPLGTPPRAQHFPMRNRIISGLSRGVLVVEAALRSGALITARNALAQNREVFAIPGSIHNPLSKGCHHLLRQGAKLVETVDDIEEEFTELPLEKSTTHPHILANQAQKLVECIDYAVTCVETIASRSGLSGDRLGPLLIELELAGHIQAQDGGYCRLLRSKHERRDH